MTLRYWPYDKPIPKGWRHFGALRNAKGKLANHAAYSFLIVKL